MTKQLPDEENRYERSLDHAISEMQHIRHTFNPLTALLLVMDYNTEELRTAINKIDSMTMDRLGLRLDVVKHLVEKKWYAFSSLERSLPGFYQYNLSVKQAAKMLELDEGTIRNAIDNGRLKYRDVHGSGTRRVIRLSPKDIEEFSMSGQ